MNRDRKFYRNDDLTHEEQVSLLRDAWKLAEVKWIDELSDSSAFREIIDMKLDEFIDELENARFEFWRFIKEFDTLLDEEVFEVFVRFHEWHDEKKEDHILRKSRDLFCHARMPFEDASKLIDEYGLKVYR